MLSLSGRGRLPLSRYCILQAGSLDEAAAAYSRIAPLRLRGMSSSRPCAMRLHHLPLGPLAVAATENTVTMQAECEGAADSYLLSIPLGEASAEATLGKTSTTIVRGKSGATCGPWQDTGVRCEAGYRGLQVSMPREAVLNAAETLTGSAPRELVIPHRFALDTPSAEPLLRLLAQIVKEADNETPRFNAAGAGERLAEALLFRFLLCQPASRSTLFSASAQPAEPRHVRRAAEYLDTHFEQHITMADLTVLTGVSARALQLGFQKYRGCSPLSFVLSRRLERARVLLLTSDAVETVSEAAQQSGIEHLGRFSLRYRARFGESPRNTLQRRWPPLPH